LLLRFIYDLTSRHYNHSYNETRTRLSALSRSLLTSSIALLSRFSYAFLNVEIYPPIVELRGLVRKRLVQGFSFVFNSALASVASEFGLPCSGNVFSFLGNTLILFLVNCCSGKTLLEPLPGNGRLCCFPTSIFRLLGIVYRALLSSGL
jgi:hypothetical protein